MVFLWRRLGPKLYSKPPGSLPQPLFPLGGGSVIVCPFALFVCGDFVFLFCNVVLSILSSFAVIWIRKRILALYLYCALAVLWLSEFYVSSLWCHKLVCGL